jgi:integrase
MAQRTQGGWKLRLPEGRGRRTYLVRFRHGGKRVERSTGKSDPREAAVEAARIYADVVSGRRTTRAAVSADLASAFASWLADYEATHATGTAETVTMYVEAHLLPFFGAFDRFTPASIGDYMRERIQVVTRSTLRKELSALRQFFAWCVEHGTHGLPVVPPLPKAGHPGVRAKNARRPGGTARPETEVKRALVAMPERSRRTGEFVRPFFTLLWETGLRESTLLGLRSPEHYKRGARRLFISRDIDKAHFERWVPLTAAARAALDRVCPRAPGLLFEGIDQATLRKSLEAAARAAGLEGAFSPYDFRHSRASQLANSGAPLAGVAFLLGHKHLSTTSLYVHTNEKAAVEALGAVMPRARAPRPAARSGGHSGGHKARRASANEGT